MEETKNNSVHTDHLSRAALSAKEGFETLRKLESLAGDYADLGYAPGAANEITAADAVGTIEGLDPKDLAQAVQGIVAIGEVLNAKDGALRKAFKRLAQYAR